MTPDQLQELTDLLSQPTAPFREHFVARHAGAFLERHGIPCFADPTGNLVVGAATPRDYQARIRSRGAGPVRVFIAHMDHPGFHGVRWLGADRLQVKWHGGAPVKHLAGAAVRVTGAEGVLGIGRLRNVRLTRERRTIDTAEVRLARTALAGRRPAARTLFGGFGFRAPVWRDGRRIFCPAADDLIGVFAVLQTARALWTDGRRRSAPPFLGLLTRAEEVGFVGAVAHLELGWLQRHRRPVLAVSLEASRQLPGAEIGRGPVVRLGDRRTVFNPDGLQALSMTAARVLPGAHQRRIMDGGACEATAVTAWGLPAIGISVPLGNYHNQGFEGGPDCAAPQGPAPEFVHRDDVARLLRLCHALMADDLDWRSPWREQRERLIKNLDGYRKLL